MQELSHDGAVWRAGARTARLSPHSKERASLKAYFTARFYCGVVLNVKVPMRRVFLAASLCLIAPLPASAFSVAMDEVHTITFETPVSTVYVGNPTIADINMIDARHAFIIGKGFGNTNIVALDSTGKQVFESPVSVLTRSARNESTVVVNRGSQRTTYSCTANACEATPAPGEGLFQQMTADAQAHSDAAHKAASGQ